MVLEDLKSFSWNRPWRPSVWCSVARLSNAFHGSRVEKNIDIIFKNFKVP